MNIITLKCPSCGASLELKELGQRTKCFCQYCGQTIILEEEHLNIQGSVNVDGIDTESDILAVAESLLEKQIFLSAHKKYKEYVSKCPDDFRGWLGLLRAKTRNYNIHDNNALFKHEVKKYYDNYLSTAPESVKKENEQDIEEYFHPELKASRLRTIEKQEQQKKAAEMEELSKRIKELKQKAKKKGGLFSRFKGN